MTTSHQIVRCIKSDFGTSIQALKSGAAYCAGIAASSALNPWSESSMSPAYADAARLLTEAVDARTIELAAAKRELETV